MSSVIPAVIENHLDAIQHLPNGTAILASSNLTGRYWGGSLWCFKNADDAPSIEKCITGVETEAGISDAVCMGKDKIIVGLDSGAVELICLQSEPSIFSSLFYSCEHDHAVTSVSVSADNMLCISSSADGCIKVWDTESWACVATYRPVLVTAAFAVTLELDFVVTEVYSVLTNFDVTLPELLFNCVLVQRFNKLHTSGLVFSCLVYAHGDMIHNVSCSSINHQLFLSCSQDDKICVWDLRLPKPATALDKTPLKGTPTAISWKPESPSEFAVGDQSGIIALKDIRNSSDAILSGKPHQRPVFRFAFSSSLPNWLASCADEENVVVTDIEKDKLEVIYKDNSHSDFVRGLSWNPLNNKLYSCGWNKEVIGHNVSADGMELGGHNEFS